MTGSTDKLNFDVIKRTNKIQGLLEVKVDKMTMIALQMGCDFFYTA